MLCAAAFALRKKASRTVHRHVLCTGCVRGQSLLFYRQQGLWFLCKQQPTLPPRLDSKIQIGIYSQFLIIHPRREERKRP